jgi:hypothetical protein
MILCLGLVGIALLLDFVVRFLITGLRINFQLRRLATSVEQASRATPDRIKQTLESEFSGTYADKAWREFEETLHERHSTGLGEAAITDIRATAPAGAFISLDNVVDPRIQVEYFRHLPGLLTGLGIIGTFTGLIQGLIAFNPSVDTSELRGSLTDLFQHVMQAFTFSGIAIAAAMLITLLEKSLYSACSNAVWRLSQQLDSLFRAGVGEEYLSSLVMSSQDSATQLRQLKETMVGELKELLTSLTIRQIQATQQLSRDLAGRQNEQVGAVVQQLVSSFATQMREIMGGQFGDLSGLMKQTSQAIAGVEVSLRALVRDMQQAGQQTTAGVQAAMHDLMQNLSEHQKNQGETVTSAISAVLRELLGALARIVAAQDAAETRARAASDITAQALNNHISSLSAENARTMSATRETMDRIGHVSSEMIDKLSSGAAAVIAAVGSVRQAAESLGRVGGEIAALQGQSQQAAHAVTQATLQLAAGAQGLGDVVTSLASVSTQFQAVASVAATEADSRGALLNDLRAVMDATKTAGGEFGRLAEEVRQTLALSVEQFGNGVGKVLSDHLFDYQKQLGSAVDMLKGALEELAEYAAKDEQ